MRRGVVWDEDNLRTHEEERVPRMRIDEPKTPYTSYMPPDEDEAALPVEPRSFDEGGALTLSAATLEAAASRIRDEWDTSDEEEEGEEEEDGGGSGEEDEEFKARRRAHYDEFRRVRELMKQGALDETDEEEEGEDGDGRRC